MNFVLKISAILSFNTFAYFLWAMFYALPLNSPSHWTIRGNCFPNFNFNLTDLCSDGSNDLKIFRNKKTFQCFLIERIRVEAFSIDPLVVLLPEFFSNKEIFSIRNSSDRVRKSRAPSFSRDRYGRLYKSPELNLHGGVIRRGYDSAADKLFEKTDRFLQVITMYIQSGYKKNGMPDLTGYSSSGSDRILFQIFYFGICAPNRSKSIAYLLHLSLSLLLRLWLSLSLGRS